MGHYQNEEWYRVAYAHLARSNPAACSDPLTGMIALSDSFLTCMTSPPPEMDMIVAWVEDKAKQLCRTNRALAATAAWSTTIVIRINKSSMRRTERIKRASQNASWRGSIRARCRAVCENLGAGCGVGLCSKFQNYDCPNMEYEVNDKLDEWVTAPSS